MIKHIAERDRIRELETQFNTARKEGSQECQKCGYCCHARSCIPTPQELKEIAKFLKLSPNQLINKYFAVDVKSFGDTYYVKPIGINQKDLVGKFIPADRTYDEGKCIFLEDTNLCKIYPVRPQSAKEAQCWKFKIYKANLISWSDDVLFKEFGIDKKTIESERGD